MEGQGETATGPPASCLIISSVLECFFTSIYFSQWRTYLPHALGNPSLNGCLSNSPPKQIFEQYNDHISYHTFLTQNHLDQSLSSLYTFAFRTPTTSLGILTSKDSIAALIILVLTIRHIKAVLLPIFCNIGRNISISTHGPDWEHKNPERIMKFGEYVFRFLYHSTLSAVGVWYFWDAPWWDESKGGTANLWLEFPNQGIDVGMIWYYLVQCAYNIDAIIYLMEHSIIIKFQSPAPLNTNGWQSPLKVSWNPNRRGDFLEMAVHHVITNLLVIGSSHNLFTRIGSMIFLVHDISDIPVDMSKLANFMKWKSTTVFCFVTMIILWIATRLVILPFVILRSVITESPELYVDGQIDIMVYEMYLPLYNILLGGLIALHTYWFFVIARIGIYLVTKGEAHDLTEHKQGEDQI